MTRDIGALFSDIESPSEESRTYPGSKRTRQALVPTDPWDAQMKYEYKIDGVDTTFYGIGTLAAALDRLPPAIRKWERLGYLPDSGFRSPSRSQRGQRRLYTRPQIEGVVQLAKEEGVLGEENRNVSSTNFPERAAKLFADLERKRKKK